MKAYTDLEQSKKLAEILPFESADMCFNISQRSNMPPLMTPYSKFNEFFNMEKTPDFLIPCWSLAALLSVISIEHNLHGYLTENGMVYRVETLYAGNSKNYDNPVDACVDMIVKLHEQNLL